MMNTTRWERIGAASGIASALLALGAFVSVPAPPKLNELGKTVTYLGDHRAGVLLQAYVFMLATGLLVWFAGSVRTHLRHNDVGSGRLPDIAFGGAVVGAAMLGASTSMLATAAFRADSAPAAANIRVMMDFGAITFAMAMIPFAVFVGACGIASYRSGAFPLAHIVASGIAAVGFAATPLLIVGKTGFFSLNDAFGGLSVAFLALLAWSAATSVMLIVGEAAEVVAEVEFEGRILAHEHWHLRRASGQ